MNLSIFRPLRGLVLCLLLWSTGASAQEDWELLLEEAPQEARASKAVYSFLREFANARAVRHRETGKVEGHWLENGFQFPGSQGGAEIFTSSNILVGGEMREVIVFSLEPDLQYGLLFFRVPPGRRLQIFLAQPDYAFRAERAGAVDFEVWVGGKMVLSTSVMQKGWLQQTVDLTLPSLLQRSFVVTLKASTLGKEPRELLVDAFIE